MKMRNCGSEGIAKLRECEIAELRECEIVRTLSKRLIIKIYPFAIPHSRIPHSRIPQFRISAISQFLIHAC